MKRIQILFGAGLLLAAASCSKDDKTDEGCANPPNSGGFQAPTTKRVTLWIAAGQYTVRLKLDSIYNTGNGQRVVEDDLIRTDIRKGFDTAPACDADSTAYIRLEKGQEYRYFISTLQNTGLRQGAVKINCSEDCQTFQIP